MRLPLSRLLLIALPLLAAVPPCAKAEPADYLRRFDSNSDGRVQLVEFQDYLGAGFVVLDKNGNGVLDLDEQPPGAKRRPLTRLQHLRALEAAFHRQDRNRDGHLDAAELSAPPG